MNYEVLILLIFTVPAILIIIIAVLKDLKSHPVEQKLFNPEKDVFHLIDNNEIKFSNFEQLEQIINYLLAENKDLKERLLKLETNETI